MSSFVSRLVAFLVAVVAVLQLVHLVLLNQLESRRLVLAERNHEGFFLEKKVEAPVQALSISPTIVDSTGDYRVYFDISRPPIPTQPPPPLDDFSIDEDVSLLNQPSELTLVTYANLQMARQYLIPLARSWGHGPLSIVLYSNSSDIAPLLELISLAQKCSEILQLYATFHVVSPLGKSPSNTSNKNRTKGCEYFEHEGGDTGGVLLVEAEMPLNLLRNVGRRRVLGGYTLVLPITMFPSEGLRERFSRMRKKELGKTVFVLPSFEVRRGGGVPRGKREIIRMVKAYEARPFQFEFCWKCQVHTDYDSWIRDPGKPDSLSIMYEVLWKDPWEPFFISSNNVPFFDESFRSLDRLSQLCELHVAGYKFAVLNEGFLVHVGYIGGGVTAVGDRPRFKQFKGELRGKYPHSTRRCY